MKKIIYSVAFLAASMFATNSYAQLIDEKDVTITMDLQPILQLNMNTSDQLEFVFDDIQDYIGGITKYAATVLKVSSSVNWDLYAVGNSSLASGGGTNHWDQQIEYGGGGAGAIDLLPLSLLELHQEPANPAAAAATGNADYSAAFSAVGATTAGQNNIFVNLAPGTQAAPTVAGKYIAGHKGTGTTDAVAGGTYLTSSALSSNYYYTIDYRILPGLPAIFPTASDDNGTTADDLVTQNTAGAYAQPGVYTMYVQYILLEDQ